MVSLKQLEKRVAEIEARNSKVGADKDWEKSLVRRGLLALFTYLAVGAYLQAIGIGDPWLNAIVPALAFMFQTLTLPFFKKIWLRMRKGDRS